MSYEVDIISLLKDIGNGKMSTIDNMTEDEVKSVSPYVLQMWIKGADVHINTRIGLTNQLVNPYIFNLQEHPKLLYKLLCYSNDLNEKVHFKFRRKKSMKNDDFKIKMLMEWHGYNKKHAADILVLLSPRDLVEIGEALGYEKDQLKKLG